MRPVPERAATYLLAHKNQPAPEAAHALDVHPRTVHSYRIRMRHMGLDAPRLNQRLDVDAVRDVGTEGGTLREIAARLEIKHASLRSGLAARGIFAYDLRRDHAYTLREVGELLGLSDKETRNLKGRIPMTQSPGRRGRWSITATALQEFLEHPACPIDPQRIADPDWRDYAVAARAGKLRAPTPLVEAPEGKLLCPACRERVVSRAGRVCRSCGTKQGQQRKKGQVR